MFRNDILLKCFFIGWLGLSMSEAFSLDLKAQYKQVSFATEPAPECSDESKYLPPLPEDTRADLYYQAAQKILGQNNSEHFEEMFILADKAAQMGHWKAKLMIAKLYLDQSDSHYTAYNPKLAKVYLTELMEQNVPIAYYMMAQNKQNGMAEFANDPIPVSVYLLEAAKLGNAQALSDLYDIFVGVGRKENALSALKCAVSQKEGTAQANLKYANTLEENAHEEKDWIEPFHYLYLAIKQGSYDAIITVANKDNYYKQEFGKSFFGSPFIERLHTFQTAMNPLYSHYDVQAKEKGKRRLVLGNSTLSFPNLEYVLPFPPAELPKWNGDLSITLSPKQLVVYQTDFDYVTLASEAKALQMTKPKELKEEGSNK